MAEWVFFFVSSLLYLMNQRLMGAIAPQAVLSVATPHTLKGPWEARYEQLVQP